MALKKKKKSKPVVFFDFRDEYGTSLFLARGDGGVFLRVGDHKQFWACFDDKDALGRDRRAEVFLSKKMTRRVAEVLGLLLEPEPS